MLRRSLLVALTALTAGGTLAAAAGALAQDDAARDDARPLDPVAIVEALEGQVFLLRGGRQVPLEVRRAVADSDEILTFPDARVRLRFADGTLVTIGPNSRCLVAFHRRDAEREGDILRLIEGILRIFTAEAASEAIKVRTRSAIASPRGTEWIVERTPGSTAVFVVDGAVAVRGTAGGAVLLEPGFGTDVPDGAPPGEPKRWGQARVDDALARTSFR